MDTVQGSVVVDVRSLDTDQDVYGFVYVDETRVGFDEVNGVWASRPSGYWPEPTPDQYDRAIEALAYKPWGGRIAIVKEWIDAHAEENEDG